MVSTRNVNSIPVVTAQVIMEAVEAISYANNGGLDVSDIANYLGKSKGYAKAASDASHQLGLTEARDSRFFITNGAQEASKATKEQSRVLFRKFLQKYGPFVLFIVLIERGNSVNEAARKVRVIYGLETSTEKITFAFINWGEFLNW